MHLGLQKIAACTVGALLFLFFAVGAKAEDGKPWPSVQSNPLVIELYTSQGCSSCPPADLMLDQISYIPGVLGLAFHVDYWDYIGWKDPYALAVSTKRQKYYRHVLGNRYIYTPQFVIGGNASPDPSSGSVFDRDLIAGPENRVTLSVSKSGILFPATEGLGTPADVWLIHFDERHKTSITDGENAGRQLGYRHVVREVQYLGDWRGQERLLEWPIKLRFGAALLVQDRRQGTILATLVTME